MLNKSLQELADFINGKVIGDGNIIIAGINSIDEAKNGEITFITNPRYLSMARTTKASAIIVSSGFKDSEKPLLCTDNPYLAYAKIAGLFHKKPCDAKGIDPGAVIGNNTEIGIDVSIYPFVYVGDNVKIGDRVSLYPGVYVGDDVHIGEDTVVYANTSIREGCKIGRRVIIHCGTVIGSDGFGFAKDGKTHHKIPQVGIVQIDDDVEIGAGNTIDRAALGKTWIKRGVKTDNLVQIGHNVIIGEDTIIVAQVAIAGSTEIGNNVVLAGQVGVGGHLKIGDNVTVGGQSGITKDIAPNQTVSGLPAIPHKEWLRSQASIIKLPKMRKTLKELESKIEKIEKKIKFELEG
ncbi:MAG: UDP-3-O-(3-hydroxymyristoyl)glucosamine N-acyltransferase [Thermodesulfobacteriota bacterium]